MTASASRNLRAKESEFFASGKMSAGCNVKSTGSGLFHQLHFFSFMRNRTRNQFVHNFRMSWLADDERFRASLQQKV
jgi:hypothetical protein